MTVSGMLAECSQFFRYLSRSTHVAARYCFAGRQFATLTRLWYFCPTIQSARLAVTVQQRSILPPTNMRWNRLWLTRLTKSFLPSTGLDVLSGLCNSRAFPGWLDAEVRACSLKPSGYEAIFVPPVSGVP